MRYGLIAVAALVVLGIVWLVAGRGDDGTAGGAARSGLPGASDGGMAGMEGMAMPGDGSVWLTAAQIRQFGVTFGSVEERELAQTVRTVGIVSFDETRLAQVSPKVSGFVERLYVDFTGQPVRRGQPLLALYAPELVAAQEELLLARRLQRDLGAGEVPGVPAGSTDLVASARRRLRLWDISEAQIDEILRTGEVQRTLTFHSPAAGVVVEKNVEEGQAVEAGQTLYRIADLSAVWVEAELREADAGAVRVGTPATVELAAYPGRTIEGRVEYVYPTLQQEARTLKARVAVPNPDGRIKPGMYATVRFTTPTRTALSVPTSAVVRTGDRAIVFVDMGGGRLMPQEVELGQATEAHAEVLAGVEPGQRVVTSAQFLLESESNLGEVMKAMMGQMGMSDMGSMEGMEGMDGMKGMQGMDMKGADMKDMSRPAPAPAPEEK
ncbi:MAG: efflux RND transporter periplasmic adaptor subunit [Brachybacterium paraconglomeratum]|jgi:multidrug efflux pump subunit AcrA (membrane-fusion protein)|nr:efflux RND transporter periplasmic adaptor subunit [Brachybacterium paraconglomeratum]